MCYMHIVEYYSALKRKEILTLATVTWMYHEDIMLSEVSQSQNAESFHSYAHRSQIHRDRKYWVGRKGRSGFSVNVILRKNLNDLFGQPNSTAVTSGCRAGNRVRA